MAVKLIVTDLDGTLLNSEKQVSERTLRAIEEARRRGVYVTIATGRMFTSAENFGKRIGVNAPLICCNGSVVQEMDSDKPIFLHTMDAGMVRRILSFCHERGWYVNWYIGKDILVEKYIPEYFHAYRTEPNLSYIETGDRFLDYTENVIQCVLRTGDGRVNEMLQELQAELGENVIVAQSFGGFCADLVDPSIHKAVGLQKLMEHLHLTPDEVMACGDSTNDYTMLELAGIAVVPENGLQGAKDRASYITSSNDEDAVGRAIEKFVL